MSEPLRVLLLEDRPADAELILHELRRAGYEPVATRVETKQEFLAGLGPELDVILADYNLPQFDAMGALHLVRESGLDVPFIIVSGSIGEELAVSGIKLGAADYLIKDRLARLGQSVAHAIEQRRLRRENEQAEAALRQAEARYRTLVEQIPAVTYVDAINEASSTMYVSPQVERIVGYPADEWMHTPDMWAKLLHPDDREWVMDEHVRTNETFEPFTAEYRVFHRDGSVVWIRDEALVVRSEDGDPRFWQGVWLDITERKRAEEQIAFLAYHDKLTGLPNRAMFEELLDLALARARRRGESVAVLYLDLDNFKLVNDSLGHAAGDELLAQTAARLKDVARETDIVARQGGDEFMLLMSDLPNEHRWDHPDPIQTAESVAKRIQDTLRVPFILAETEFYVSASIGISVFPQHAEDHQSLLRDADSAMYQSKRWRRGAHVVYASEAGDPLSELSFNTQLRRAVEHNHWILHYQPLIGLRDGATIGVEALIRWKDPGGELILPGMFIGLAEDLGLSEAIGDWVLDEVCMQAKRFDEAGLDLTTTFNISPRQLRRKNLVRRVISAVENARIDPSKMVIEITEATAMTDPDRTEEILWDLHSSGIRLAIDDFGIGYSNLSRLKHLPVDILKIDRSFVGDLAFDQDARSIVTAIIQLASALGLEPLAEGIETEDQCRFLVERDCPLGQGYLFSRPLPAADIMQRLAGSPAGSG
jgi:diguanylate cyclase (GGDEF)-like protein/PAS domain S-box-containing protein